MNPIPICISQDASMEHLVAGHYWAAWGRAVRQTRGVVMGSLGQSGLWHNYFNTFSLARHYKLCPWTQLKENWPGCFSSTAFWQIDQWQWRTSQQTMHQLLYITWWYSTIPNPLLGLEQWRWFVLVWQGHTILEKKKNDFCDELFFCVCVYRRH